jgi:hypothetical protein
MYMLRRKRIGENMSSTTVTPSLMQRGVDAAKGYVKKLKDIPPDAGEAQAIKEKQAQVDALKSSPVIVPESARTGAEPTPMLPYGSRPGEKRLDYALKPAPTAVPVYDNGGDIKKEDVHIATPAEKKTQSPLAMKPVIHETMDVDTGKPASSLPPLTPDIKPMPTAPLYDEGGTVGINHTEPRDSPKFMSMKAPDQMEYIQEHEYQPAARFTGKDSIYHATPEGQATLLDTYTGKEGHTPSEVIGYPIGKSPQYPVPAGLRKMAPVYDDGGTVDVNDGQHQVAVLKEGERVLTPEENEQYKKEHPETTGAPADFGGRVIPNPKGIKPMDSDAPYASTPMTYPGGARMNIDNAPLNDKESDKTFPTAMPTEASAKSTARPYAEVEAEQKKAAEEKVANPGAQVSGDQQSTQTQVPEKPEQLPTAAHEERVAIKQDEQDAMGKGVQGLAQLGTAKIHAKQLGITPSIEGVTAPKEFARPEQGGFPKMGEATPEATPAASAAGPAAPASAPTTTSERSPDFKAKLAQLNQDHANALAERTPEGKVKADYIQEQINDLHKNNPFGTAGNHPGALGRLGHIASKFGNLAGDVFAPATMELVPGTDLNKRVQEGGLQRQTQADVQEATAADKADKGAAAPTWKPLGQPVHNPATGKDEIQYYNEKDPSQVKFGGEFLEKPSEAKSDDQAQYVAKYKKDNNLPDTAENDAKAIKSYQDAHATPALMEQHNADGSITYVPARAGTTVAGPQGKAGSAATEENKFKGKTLYFDTPEGGRQAYTYQEAKDAGLSPEDGVPVNAGQAQKDRDKVDSFNSISKAFDKYQQEVNKAEMKPSDVPILTAMTTDPPDTLSWIDKITGSIASGLMSHPLTGYSEQLMGGTLSKSMYQDLSPAGRRLAADYYTAMMAHFANMKATQGTIPRNPAIIQTEMHTVPKPYLTAEEAGPAFQNYMDGVQGRNNNNVKFPEKQEKIPVPTVEDSKYHMQSSKGQILSNDGKTWYDLQGKQIGK